MGMSRRLRRAPRQAPSSEGIHADRQLSMGVRARCRQRHASVRVADGDYDVAAAARHGGMDALDDQDVYFNLWRLRWIAHALATSAGTLFDANIFVPEHGVLAYSDAMLVEGVMAAPLLWLGVAPVLVHNLMLLGAIAASGIAAFLLARHLTGSGASAVVAGVIFAFAPYRFAHYAHLELQWVVWSPCAFWGRTNHRNTFGQVRPAHRPFPRAADAVERVLRCVPVGVDRDCGASAGDFVIRTATGANRGGGRLGSGPRRVRLGHYSRPYADAAARVGLRTTPEVSAFSARPADYRIATRTNVLYGRPEAGSHERQLFPGILPPVLAVVGLLLLRPTIPVVAYLIGLVVAFELSLGAHGQLYPLLFEHFSVFRGLRAPARASVFVLLFLGVLAAYGTAALTSSMKLSIRRAVTVVVCAIVLLDTELERCRWYPYPNTPPRLYVLLAKLPPGIVAEFPMPRPSSAPYHDPRFAYMSTFHWQRLVNGTAGSTRRRISLD